VATVLGFVLIVVPFWFVWGVCRWLLHEWPERTDHVHSVIAGTVASVITLMFAPWWAAALVLIGTTSFLLLRSQQKRERERCDLLEWKRLAECELNLTIPSRARPWYGESPQVYVEGTLGDMIVTIAREISAQDSGPLDWYLVKIERDGLRTHTEFASSLTRNELLENAKHLLHGRQAHQGAG
jgi:hypothetical protein